MKSKRLVIAALSLTLVATGPSHAGRAASVSRWMTEAEIRAVFVKHAVAGTLPDGQPWTELMREDGRSDYVEGGRPLDGRWWFDEHGQLCFRYVSGSGGCFRYLQLSDNCYEHFFSTNQLPIPGAPVGRDVTSNGPLWRQDEPPTCDARPSA